MDKAYLESFTDQQLEHYASTLQKRIKDLRELTMELTAENQELGQTYEDLIQQKTFVYHKNEKRKKSWTNWFNKSKEKIGTFLHISKSPNNRQQIQPEPETKPQVNHPYHTQEEEGQPNEDTPKRKVLNLFEMGKQKITKLFHSNKSKEEVQPQEGGERIGNDAQQNKFQFLSELVKENTNHQSKYSEFIQRTQEQRLKRQRPEEQSNQKAASPDSKYQEQKKEPSSFEKITKHVVNHRGVEQNATLEKQTTAFQPLQVPSKGQTLAEEGAAKLQEAVEPIQQVKGQLIKQKESEPIEKKQESSNQRESDVVVQNNPVEQVVQEEDAQDDEYAIRYDDPINNYELQEGALSQIVEKQAPSQDELDSPSKASSKPSTQELAKEQPQQSK